MRLSFLFFILTISIGQAQIQLNNHDSEPYSSALFEVKSTERGVLIPRMTSEQRDAIISPEIGLMIFNLSDSCFNYYTGTDWYKDCGRSLTSDATDLPANSYGGAGTDRGESMTIDSDGNILIAGLFSDTFTIGDSTFTSAGSFDIFIAKFDSANNFLWAKQIGGAASDRTPRLITDTNNNIYIAGNLFGTIDIDGSTLTPLGSIDAFIAKLNSSGTTQWAIQMGCDDNAFLEAMNIDSNDDIYVSGAFTGNMTLGTTTLSSSTSDAFFAKLVNSGTWQWAVQSNTTEYVNTYDIAISGTDVYWCGEMEGITTFGSATFSTDPSLNNQHGYLVKYDTLGNFQWATEITSTNYAAVYGIVIDDNSDVIVTGITEETTVIGPTTYNLTNDAGFLVKYNSSGTHQWTTLWEGSGNVLGWRVAKEGNDLFVFGQFAQTMTFDNTTYTSNGSTDIFFAKFDNNGNETWIRTGGGPSQDSYGDLEIDNNGIAHVLGYYQGTSIFGNQTLTASGGSDVLWIQYNTDDGSQAIYDNSLSASQDNDTDASNELQDLSLSGSTLSISSGSSVDLASLVQDTDAIQDADNDTKIQVEESSDEDIIRFDLAGTEHFTFQPGRLAFLNSGTSVAIGEGAGENDILNNTRNVFIGYQTGFTNTSGINNMAVGYEALYTNNGNDNTAIGYQALYNNTSGEGNLALGTGAGLNNQEGNNNVLIGVDAGLGSSLHNKSNNVMIGFGAGAINEGLGNVFLGYNAGANSSGSNELFIDNSNTTSPLIYGRFDANQVVINGNDGNNSGNYTLFVNGTIGSNSATSSHSDRRLKSNIETVSSALRKVTGLRGVTFEWKDGREKGKRLGFIAQEVEKVLPEVVNRSSDYYTMQYAPITALLVEAVKEQQLVINQMQKTIADLKEQNQKINKLEAMLLEMKPLSKEKDILYTEDK